MIRVTLRIALGPFLCGLLVASSAFSEEPRSRPRAAITHTALHGVEPKSPAGLRHAPSLPFGLRLPRFLAFGGWSAPSMTTRGAPSTPRPTDCRYQCTGTQVPTDRSRATTSAILAGVGAAAVVTGVVLTIAVPRKRERPGLAPTFRMKLSGQRAVASADWSF
jgi:hypothetical protein